MEEEERGDAFYNELNYEFCPACDGTREYIGTLGNLIWLRCIDCGMFTYVEKDVIDG